MGRHRHSGLEQVRRSPLSILPITLSALCNPSPSLCAPLPLPHLLLCPSPLSLFPRWRPTSTWQRKGSRPSPSRHPLSTYDLTWQKYGLSFLSSSLGRAMNRKPRTLDYIRLRLRATEDAVGASRGTCDEAAGARTQDAMASKDGCGVCTIVGASGGSAFSDAAWPRQMVPHTR